MSLTISEPMMTLLVGLLLVAASRTLRSLNTRTTAAMRPGSGN